MKKSQTQFIDLYPSEFLKVDELPTDSDKFIRVAVLALVEQRDTLLTNRLYLIDVTGKDGNTASFVHGYAGGGGFSECSFWNDKILNDVSDAQCEEDEGVVAEFSIFDLPDHIKELIEPYKCHLDEDDDVYRYTSLENFIKKPNDDLYVLYRTWVNMNSPLEAVRENDRQRLKKIILKSGILMTDPMNW